MHDTSSSWRTFRIPAALMHALEVRICTSCYSLNCCGFNYLDLTIALQQNMLHLFICKRSLIIPSNNCYLISELSINNYFACENMLYNICRINIVLVVYTCRTLAETVHLISIKIHIKIECLALLVIYLKLNSIFIACEALLIYSERR